jgi:AcrR family transcriptional regulator
MTARRTQAERRAETERRVLDATMAIIADRGVRAVTMAAVGEAAGYSRGIVNHQFGTRRALMAAVAETVQSRFAPTASGLTGRERVVAMFGAYLGQGSNLAEQQAGGGRSCCPRCLAPPPRQLDHAITIELHAQAR